MNKNTNILKIIAANMFRHPNFWNVQNFKNRIHVIGLQFLPAPQLVYKKVVLIMRGGDDPKITKAKTLLNDSQLNFWSACGDPVDYKYYLGRLNNYNNLINTKYNQLYEKADK